MSRENLEIVRHVYEAVDRGDNGAVLAAYEPDVEMDFTQSPLVALFKQDVYKGHDGLRSFFRERYEEAWGTIEDVCEELVDAGGDHVVSVIRTRGRGRVSGAEVEIVHAGLWTLRGDKIVRLRMFGSREDALAAAGPMNDLA
jgi:ketosteroid isomerase-like protein